MANIGAAFQMIYMQDTSVYVQDISVVIFYVRDISVVLFYVQHISVVLFYV